MTDSDSPSLLDVLTALQEAQSTDADDADDIAILTDWKVKSDGRLTIPKNKRQKYGIEEGDDIDAILMVQK